MKVEIREITTTKEVYVAFDGKEFENQDECITYEMDFKEKSIEFYDDEFQPTDLDRCIYTILRTEQDRADLLELLDYRGIVNYGIKELGTYMNIDDTWYNITDILAKLPWRKKFYEENN